MSLEPINDAEMLAEMTAHELTVERIAADMEMSAVKALLQAAQMRLQSIERRAERLNQWMKMVEKKQAELTRKDGL